MDDETASAQNRTAYVDGLAEQVSARKAQAQLKKQQDIQANRQDDLRVEREAAVFRQQAEAEIAAQRAREALVARREAFAQQQYATSQQQSRADKVEAYQRTLEAQSHANGILGGDGWGKSQLGQHKQTAAMKSAAREEMEAGLARAAASGTMRPDQEADNQAAAIRKRNQGSSVFF